ncbi:sodium channel protein Nach [Manduca sexta]|uniref:sodium channel protein Nach n=1 Tax=Manduca sexta TaxID=7130 RepID=UPI00188F5372|nr:sodium channel protein Nach [Manduca sexta]
MVLNNEDKIAIKSMNFTNYKQPEKENMSKKSFCWQCWNVIQPIYLFAFRSNIESDEWFHVSPPRRVTSCGYQTALTVLLRTDPDDYYSASVASQGSMVFIDNAYNVPDLDSPVRMVNPSTEVLIALSPERTYTTPGVKAFTPDQRQCYYNDEIKIADFRQYSFHNCMAYQKIVAIKNICDCVPFFFAVKEYHRTCNFNDMDCLEFVLTPDPQKEDDKIYFDSFQCLPECEHYEYPLEVALGKLANNIKSSELPFFKDVNLENRSLLNVFFNDLVSTRYRRDVYLNWQNILAAFGGLLSLMLGFTLISGFDLILFLVLRVLFVTTKTHMNNKVKSRGPQKKEAWVDVSMNHNYTDSMKKWKKQTYYSQYRY